MKRTGICEGVAACMLATIATPALADSDDLLPAPVPDVPTMARSASGFVPPGWEIERTARGDLNGDKRPDLALVIRSTDKNLIIANPNGLGADSFNSNPRAIIVALNLGARGYGLSDVSTKLIPRIDNAIIDDPFGESEMVIKKGVLLVSIRFWASAGSWSMSNTTFTFRDQNEAVQLIGYDQTHIHRASGEMTTTSVNYMTGRMSIGKGSIEHDRVKKTWKNIGKTPLLRLSEMENGWDFDPARGSDN